MLVANAIGWIVSPAGRIMLVGLAFLAWTAYQRGDARSDCQDTYLRAELKETNRLLVAAQDLAEENSTRADQREIEIAELKEAANALRYDIPESGACVLPDHLREQLLRIK